MVYADVMPSNHITVRITKMAHNIRIYLLLKIGCCPGDARTILPELDQEELHYLDRPEGDLSFSQVRGDGCLSASA
jgi:hypothetical protein